MPVELYHLIAFLTSVTFVLWTIPDVKTLGLKLGIVDRPNARKIHQKPVVRVGGVSIFAGTITSLIIVWLLGGFSALAPQKVTEVWAVIIGSILFFGIGFADDLFNLTPISRLLMQVAVAAGCWYMGVRIEFVSFPVYSLVQIYWLSLPVTIV
jgi:UDP-GlcNAc:undecaprenyl-phosphate GlcNAc-1-phosphate transferase